MIECQLVSPSPEYQAQSQPVAEQALEHVKWLHEHYTEPEALAGWMHYPDRHGYGQLSAIEKAKDSFDHAYDTIVVLGIGGSFAGARAVRDAFTSPYERTNFGAKPRLLFAGCDLSEAEILDLLATLDESTPIINVISKSGTTLETSVAFRIMRSYLETRFGRTEALGRIIVTTDPTRGSLREFAKQHGCLSFSIPEDIGGRFSVLSPVGLVPLVFAGFNVKSLLDGADKVFKSLVTPTIDNPVVQLATVRKIAWDSGAVIDVLSYAEPRLTSFVEWWKQLFGESEGKDGKGLYPSGMLYSTDLHSLGQYLQDGPSHILETFLSIERPVSSQAAGREMRIRIPTLPGAGDRLEFAQGRFVHDVNLAAQAAGMTAHRDRGLTCVELKLHQLTEYELGSLLAFFQATCAVSAKLLGVNPFDQPGVEAYKSILRRIL